MELRTKCNWILEKKNGNLTLCPEFVAAIADCFLKMHSPGLVSSSWLDCQESYWLETSITTKEVLRSRLPSLPFSQPTFHCLKAELQENTILGHLQCKDKLPIIISALHVAAAAFAKTVKLAVDCENFSTNSSLPPVILWLKNLRS